MCKSCTHQYGAYAFSKERKNTIPHMFIEVYIERFEIFKQCTGKGWATQSYKMIDEQNN
jgi:hypothetical protein